MNIMYINGFNSGYILATHKPDLAELVIKNLTSRNDYIEGLINGKEQLELEKNKEMLSEIDALRNPEKIIEKDMTRS